MEAGRMSEATLEHTVILRRHFPVRVRPAIDGTERIRAFVFRLRHRESTRLVQQHHFVYVCPMAHSAPLFCLRQKTRGLPPSYHSAEFKNYLAARSCLSYESCQDCADNKHTRIIDRTRYSRSNQTESANQENNRYNTHDCSN